MDGDNQDSFCMLLAVSYQLGATWINALDFAVRSVFRSNIIFSLNILLSQFQYSVEESFYSRLIAMFL